MLTRLQKKKINFVELLKKLFLISLTVSIILSPLWTSSISLIEGLTEESGWNLVDYPSYSLNAISFGNTTHGIAVGDNGLVLRTDDGGLIWKPQFVETPDSYSPFMDLTDIVFVTETIAIAAARNSQDYILRTEDAGKTWKTITWVTWGVHDLDFVDEKNGWFCGYGTIYRTQNGGESWSKKFENSMLVHCGVSTSLINRTDGLEDAMGCS